MATLAKTTQFSTAMPISASERCIPVELNEPHHWGMRDAADVTFVVSAYLSAYNAREGDPDDLVPRERA